MNPSAANLLKLFLEPDPNYRMSVKDALNHESFKPLSLIELTHKINKIDVNIERALVKLDNISGQLEDLDAFTRQADETLQLQAQRYHEDDKNYFIAQKDLLDAQFVLLKSVDGKIDGMSEQLTRGFIHLETSLDRMVAKISVDMINNNTQLIDELGTFKTQLKILQTEGIALDSKKIVEIMKTQLGSLGDDMKSQVKQAMTIMIQETSPDNAISDPSQQDKLNAALLEMVSATQNQIKDVKSNMDDLKVIAKTQLIQSSDDKNFMPHTFILVPLTTEDESENASNTGHDKSSSSSLLSRVSRGFRKNLMKAYTSVKRFLWNKFRV